MRPFRAAVVVISLCGFVGCSRDSYRLAGFKRQDDGKIVFELRKGEQQAEAACHEGQGDCSNLVLKAGSSVNCYTHASPPAPDFIPADFDPKEYGKKIDPYTASGLVCHAEEGRGRVLVMHTHECVEMKQLSVVFDGTKFNLLPQDEPWAKYAEGVITAYVPVTFDSEKINAYVQELSDREHAETGNGPPQQGWQDYNPAPAANDALAQKFAWTEVPVQPAPYQRLKLPPGATLLSAPDQSQYHYIKLPDGSYGKFRADATDEQIKLAISKDFPAAYKSISGQPPNVLWDPIVPRAYEGYAAAAKNPLHFCKDDQDRYFDESGKEVKDDTVLLTVLQSVTEKH